jgi:hypothetical protein
MILLLMMGAGTAVWWLAPSDSCSSCTHGHSAALHVEPPAVSDDDTTAVSNRPSTTQASEADPVQLPVQPIEERGDAMLFEIDVLQSTPFDKEVVAPFDQ